MATVAFVETSKALADATILEYPEHDAPFSPMLSIFGVAVAVVLQ